ncbi:Mitochondrial transcription termination factor family protein [Prunus dulcis]|uniref:Mitochondrial transcription termination factor family protein n=1 Tax=Prunus dulcis TaxID=3755 RepID=A0A4Y1S2F9_PRUDU|nr:Mitochondrial transcription termination factor family protein [Prunus dulcis]
MPSLIDSFKSGTMKIRSYAGITKPSFLLVHPELPALTSRNPQFTSLFTLRIPCNREKLTGMITRSQYSVADRRSATRYGIHLCQIKTPIVWVGDKENDRMENRARVYEFLRGIGIVPDELDGLELPVTVEVMRNVVKKNMIPVLDYLGKLGVRKSTFTEFLRRYPQVLHASVVIDLSPVVKYLQGMDIKPDDIPRVLERYPEVLGFKLEGP